MSQAEVANTNKRKAPASSAGGKKTRFSQQGSPQPVTLQSDTAVQEVEASETIARNNNVKARKKQERSAREGKKERTVRLKERNARKELKELKKELASKEQAKDPASTSTPLLYDEWSAGPLRLLGYDVSHRFFDALVEAGDIDFLTPSTLNKLALDYDIVQTNDPIARTSEALAPIKEQLKLMQVQCSLSSPIVIGAPYVYEGSKPIQAALYGYAIALDLQAPRYIVGSSAHWHWLRNECAKSFLRDPVWEGEVDSELLESFRQGGVRRIQAMQHAARKQARPAAPPPVQAQPASDSAQASRPVQTYVPLEELAARRALEKDDDPDQSITAKPENPQQVVSRRDTEAQRNEPKKSELPPAASDTDTQPVVTFGSLKLHPGSALLSSGTAPALTTIVMSNKIRFTSKDACLKTFAQLIPAENGWTWKSVESSSSTLALRCDHETRGCKASAKVRSGSQETWKVVDFEGTHTHHPYGDTSATTLATADVPASDIIKLRKNRKTLQTTSQPSTSSATTINPSSATTINSSITPEQLSFQTILNVALAFKACETLSRQGTTSLSIPANFGDILSGPNRDPGGMQAFDNFRRNLALMAQQNSTASQEAIEEEDEIL